MRRLRPLFPSSALVAVLLVLAAAAVALAGGVLRAPAPAGAAVEHGNGFVAVVDGFRSWYGSYRLGDLGEVWCVDHGIPAPDVALGYEPTALDDHAADTRRAIAWAVGRHGPGADRVTAAALMLVLHDLMGARYPSGPLVVEDLEVGDLDGFEGLEVDVLARARLIKADAVGRSHLTGPLALAVSTDGDVAGRSGVLRATVTDASGAPIDGVVVHPAVTGAEVTTDVDVATDGEGVASWRYLAGEGTNRFALSASVPGAELLALRPTQGTAQRVARPAAATVAGETAVEAVVPRRFTIAKRGDAEARLPVAGARFSVDGREVVVGSDGRTPPIELLPGSYVVTEVEAPPGYDVAGPWTVVAHDADVVLEVTDPARRGTLAIEKVDARTGAPVAGAGFEVRGDVDADPSTFEVEIVDPSAPLLPGRYSVREVTAPSGFRLAPDPVVVEVRGGEQAVARIADVPLVTVAFEKRPALGGATFAVRDGPGADAAELGRCTTGDDGRCRLPDGAVEGGVDVCWEEVVAPAGWGRAEGACLATGAAGSVLTIGVDEPALPAPAPAPPAEVAVQTAEVLAAPPIEAPHAPEPAPAPQPESNPVAAAPELPRTGASLQRWSGFALVLVGAGLLLVASGGASSSGSRGRRGARRRPRAGGDGRCRP